MPDPQPKCPKCGKRVDRIDGEYSRHNIKGELCIMSKRDVVQESW